MFFCSGLRIHAKSGFADSIREQAKAFSSYTSNAKKHLQLENVPCADDMSYGYPLLKACYLKRTRPKDEM